MTDTNNGKLAAVLVRGRIGMTQSVRDTLDMLNLKHKNFCVVVDNNPMNLGMLKKVKDYITFGEVTEETFKKLVEARGEAYLGRETDTKGKYKYNFMEVDGKKYKKYFRLNPPRKGFGRKGIKMSYNAGGALSYRGDKINDLIERML